MHEKASLPFLDESNLTMTNLCEIYMIFAAFLDLITSFPGLWFKQILSWASTPQFLVPL